MQRTCWFVHSAVAGRASTAGFEKSQSLSCCIARRLVLYSRSEEMRKAQPCVAPSEGGSQEPCWSRTRCRPPDARRQHRQRRQHHATIILGRRSCCRRFRRHAAVSARFPPEHMEEPPFPPACGRGCWPKHVEIGGREAGDRSSVETHDSAARAWAGHSDEAWTVSLSTDGGAAATASAPLVPRGLTVVTAADGAQLACPCVTSSHDGAVTASWRSGGHSAVTRPGDGAATAVTAPPAGGKTPCRDGAENTGPSRGAERGQTAPRRQSLSRAPGPRGPRRQVAPRL